MSNCPTCGANASGLACEFCGTQLMKPANVEEEVAALKIAKAAFLSVASGGAVQAIQAARHRNTVLSTIQTPTSEVGGEMLLGLVEHIVDDARNHQRRNAEKIGRAFRTAPYFNDNGILDSTLSRLKRAREANQWSARFDERIATTSALIDTTMRENDALSKENPADRKEEADQLRTTLLWLPLLLALLGGIVVLYKFLWNVVTA